MNKKILIVVLALVLVGGGGLIASGKLGNKNAEIKTTAEGAKFAAVEEIVASEADERVEEAPATNATVTNKELVNKNKSNVTENKVKPEVETTAFEKKVTEAVTKDDRAETKAETTTNLVERISREKAKSIALNHAGLKEANVRELEIELDYEKGAYVYEVSFESGKYDYEYYIDAATGTIKFFEKEAENTVKVTEATTKVNKPDKPAETTTNLVERISREKAKSIALNHAGLKEADVRELEIELDNEKGAYVYEVSFESGKYDYEYYIDAATGTIKFFEKEAENTVKVTEATTKVNKPDKPAETTTNSVEKISREKAKSIALNHAGLKEADVRGLEIELDYEKGAYVYEVSFESGNYEYEYVIDAYSGAIKFSEKEPEDDVKENKTETKAETTTNSVEKISREKAKSIALNHAGLKEADVRELEIELDYEKGVYVYEVSFESGNYEYEYEIDAYSGAIKFSEKDFDD